MNLLRKVMDIGHKPMPIRVGANCIRPFLIWRSQEPFPDYLREREWRP
jgi:hypothetical protein